MVNIRPRLRRKQYHVAVFVGGRARDLVGVFAVIAGDEGDAFQQCWDYVRDNWTKVDPARLEYHAVIGVGTGHRRVRS